MPRTVLVADPDKATLRVATTVLTRNGFRVESTNDGGDALARYFESSPSLVICDAELPVLGGAQLCRHIREQDSNVRLILVGGSDEQHDADTIGCDVVLSRPFRFDPIKQLLTEWGLLEEKKFGVGETVTFGVPAAPALSGGEPEPAEEVEIAPDAVEAISPPEPASETEPAAPTALDEVPMPVAPPAQPSASVRAPMPVPVPCAPSFAPATVAATSSSTPAAADVPLPIPVPVPTGDEEEPAIELDPERVAAPESRQPLAGKGLPPSIPRVGTLNEVSLPRLLFELYVGTYSGKLHLYRKGSRRTVFIWAGLPVFVDSDQLEERLGVLLRDEGRITQEQYDRGTELSLERGVRMGEALIELGFITGADLLEALEAQTEKKLINTLSWRDGSFKLVDDTSFAEGEVLTDVQPLRVIWRGVHEHYDLTAMMSFFAKLRDRYVVTTDLFPVQFEALGPHLRDLSVSTWLDGKTTFEEALRSDDTRALDIAQALYVLLVTDMIRPSVKPGEPAPVIERKKAEAAPAAPVDYRFLMEVSDRIAKEYLRIKGKDCYAILGIPRDATSAAIDEAHRDAVGAARKDLKRPGLPHESLKRTREIIDALTQAHATLSDANERQSYDAGLSTLERDASTGGAEMDRQKALFTAEQAYREGVRLLEMLDARGARQQFEKALLGNPAEPTYRVAIAQAILVEHKNDPAAAHVEAFIYLEDALRIDPGNIPANLEAAQLFVTQQMPDQARAHLERVLQRAPHHQKARRLMESLG